MLESDPAHALLQILVITNVVKILLLLRYLDPDAAWAQSRNRKVVVQLKALGDAVSANAAHLFVGRRRR